MLTVRSRERQPQSFVSNVFELLFTGGILVFAANRFVDGNPFEAICILLAGIFIHGVAWRTR